MTITVLGEGSSINITDITLLMEPLAKLTIILIHLKNHLKIELMSALQLAAPTFEFIQHRRLLSNHGITYLKCVALKWPLKKCSCYQSGRKTPCLGFPGWKGGWVLISPFSQTFLWQIPALPHYCPSKDSNERKLLFWRLLLFGLGGSQRHATTTRGEGAQFCQSFIQISMIDLTP